MLVVDGTSDITTTHAGIQGLRGALEAGRVAGIASITTGIGPKLVRTVLKTLVIVEEEVETVLREPTR